MIEKENNNNEVILQQQSHIWQLTLPYNTKKRSVFMLLMHIFYIVTIAILIFLGLYYLFFSSSSTSYQKQFNEVKTKWNTTICSAFKSLSIEVFTKNNSIQLIPNESNWHSSLSIYTNPLMFYSSKGALLFHHSSLNEKYNDILLNDYNLSISISLNISGTIIPIEDIDGIIKTRTQLDKDNCQKKEYVYNEENDICYQFFSLKSLCLIIDVDTKALINEYKEFKCNMFSPWYESFKILKWPFPDTLPGSKQIEDQGLIEIKILSNKDPYVWDSYNKERLSDNDADSSSNRHFIVGIWMVVIALGLIILGLWFYFKALREKETARIENIKQHHHQSNAIQMAEFTESSESDTKVRIPTGIILNTHAK